MLGEVSNTGDLPEYPMGQGHSSEMNDSDRRGSENKNAQSNENCFLNRRMSLEILRDGGRKSMHAKGTINHT